MTQNQTTTLVGCTVDWGKNSLDIDALVAPLGLSGAYIVQGIEPREEDLPPHYTQHNAWYEQHYIPATQFTIVLTPEMTPLHVVRLAALEHQRRQGDRWDGPIFFERFDVRDDGVIELGMGS